MISLVFCAVVVGATIFLALNFNTPPALPPIQEDNEEDEKDNSLKPTLQAPSVITIEILDTYTFNPQLTNVGNYVLSISIENTNIAEINDNNVITPKTIGTTKIICIINTQPLIKTETTLNIIDCTKDVNFNILNENRQSVTEFYTNTTYILEISHNILPSVLPEIYYSNLSKFNLIETSSSCYYFEFMVKDAGEFTFEYVGKYVSLNKNYTAVNLPTDYKINFSRNVDGNITLNIFNLNYINQANENNIFNTISFEIATTNSLDIVSTTVSNPDIVSVNNGVITALKYGTTTITFSSSLSKVTKVYTITVKDVLLNGIIVNNKEQNLYTEETIEVGAGEIYNFSYLPSPIYSLCNLTTKYNCQEISYSGNTISLLNNVKTSRFEIFNNETMVYCLIINSKNQIGHKVEVTNPNGLQIINNVLEVDYSISFIQITCSAYDLSTNENLTTQNFSVDFSNKNICVLAEQNASSGIINIRLKSIGETKIYITNTQTNQIVEFIIKVV